MEVEASTSQRMTASRCVGGRCTDRGGGIH